LPSAAETALTHPDVAHTTSGNKYARARGVDCPDPSEPLDTTVRTRRYSAGATSAGPRRRARARAPVAGTSAKATPAPLQESGLQRIQTQPNSEYGDPDRYHTLHSGFDRGRSPSTPPPPFFSLRNATTARHDRASSAGANARPHTQRFAPRRPTINGAGLPRQKAARQPRRRTSKRRRCRACPGHRRCSLPRPPKRPPTAPLRRRQLLLPLDARGRPGLPAHGRGHARRRRRHGGPDHRAHVGVLRRRLAVERAATKGRGVGRARVPRARLAAGRGGPAGPAAAADAHKLLEGVWRAAAVRGVGGRDPDPRARRCLFRRPARAGALPRLCRACGHARQHCDRQAVPRRPDHPRVGPGQRAALRRGASWWWGRRWCGQARPVAGRDGATRQVARPKSPRHGRARGIFWPLGARPGRARQPVRLGVRRGARRRLLRRLCIAPPRLLLHPPLPEPVAVVVSDKRRRTHRLGGPLGRRARRGVRVAARRQAALCAGASRRARQTRPPPLARRKRN
jgi:hypothetical protein